MKISMSFGKVKVKLQYSGPLLILISGLIIVVCVILGAGKEYIEQNIVEPTQKEQIIDDWILYNYDGQWSRVPAREMVKFSPGFAASDENSIYDGNIYYYREHIDYVNE